MKSRLLSAGIAAVAALSLTLTACTGDTTPTGAGAPGPSTSQDAANEKYTIGTAIIISHPSLQAVLDGFEEVLKEQNVNYELINENAQGESANAATIASSFVDNKDIDLILAISTPIALAMASAEKERPILFSASTDPVKDGLVPSWDQAGTNITGTSDLNPEAKPVEVITQAMPGVKTIGVLHSSVESNSLIQVEAFQAQAAELGVTLKPQSITSAAEVSVGLEALADVDAILIPTDNIVVAALANVIGFGREHKIPVFCADSDSVAKGTVATRGLSYHDMGRTTAEMAIKILRDDVPISEIKPEAPTSTDLYVNPEAAESFGLTLPADFVSQGTIVKTAA